MARPIGLPFTSFAFLPSAFLRSICAAHRSCIKSTQPREQFYETRETFRDICLVLASLLSPCLPPRNVRSLPFFLRYTSRTPRAHVTRSIIRDRTRSGIPPVGETRFELSRNYFRRNVRLYKSLRVFPCIIRTRGAQNYK